MSRGHSLLSLSLVAGLVALAAEPACGRSAWETNDAGECVRVWSAAELGRGPIAMTNGVLLPIRELAGGATDGVWGVVWLPIAVAGGAVEGLGWVSAGFLDTLTGGAFAISPDGIAQLHAGPVLQLPEGHRSYEAYAVDRPQVERAGCEVE